MLFLRIGDIFGLYPEETAILVLLGCIGLLELTKPKYRRFRKNAWRKLTGQKVRR